MRDVEFARGVAREQVVGDFARLLEAEHLVLAQLMVGEDRVRVEATQHAALLAGEVEAHGLALRLQLLRIAAGGADDVAVERTGEAAFEVATTSRGPGPCRCPTASGETPAPPASWRDRLATTASSRSA